MCEVWSDSSHFEAACIVSNPKTGNRFKVPLWFPIYFFDRLGTRKPLGVPLDRSIEVEGPLVYAGFGITDTNRGWDDFGGRYVEGNIVVISCSVPRKDFERFPFEPYGTSDYKVSNAFRHGAKAVVLIGNMNKVPSVSYGDEGVGIFIPEFLFDLILTELQRGISLRILKARIENSMKPIPLQVLNLDMKISFIGNRFERFESEHFIFFFHKGSPAERDISKIAERREEAYRKIADILDVKVQNKIRCFLFPSAREKTFYTGHIGAGFAQNQTIIEIYNDEIRDHYHELTHIVAAKLNQNAPPLLSEGLAVYITSRMEKHPLDEKVKLFKEKDELIPITKLLRFEEIGSEASKPLISYPESGSFVKYLIEEYGLEKFKQIYSKTTKGLERSKYNEKVFLKVYGKDINHLAKEWLNSL